MRRKPTIEIYNCKAGNRKGTLAFRFKGTNGEIIAQGEGYVDEAGLLNALRLIASYGSDPNSWTVKRK